MDQGRQAGEDKGGHQPGYPEWDTEQRHQLDVPAADPAVCGKGDGKQEDKARPETRSGPYAPVCRGKPRKSMVHQQG